MLSVAPWPGAVTSPNASCFASPTVPSCSMYAISSPVAPTPCRRPSARAHRAVDGGHRELRDVRAGDAAAEERDRRLRAGAVELDAGARGERRRVGRWVIVRVNDLRERRRSWRADASADVSTGRTLTPLPGTGVGAGAAAFDAERSERAEPPDGGAGPAGVGAIDSRFVRFSTGIGVGGASAAVGTSGGAAPTRRPPAP